MFSAVYICLSVRLFVNTTSKHRMLKLGVSASYKKFRPRSNLEVLATWERTPKNVAFAATTLGNSAQAV